MVSSKTLRWLIIRLSDVQIYLNLPLAKLQKPSSQSLIKHRGLQDEDFTTEQPCNSIADWGLSFLQGGSLSGQNSLSWNEEKFSGDGYSLELHSDKGTKCCKQFYSSIISWAAVHNYSLQITIHGYLIISCTVYIPQVQTRFFVCK
jgi:hypothetical protein